MSTELNITIYDEHSQELLVHDLKFNSGVIVTQEMQKGAPKITTSMHDIKSSDYDIIDVGIKQFDDNAPLDDKINSCLTRINLYLSELNLSETFLQTTYSTEYNRISNEIARYEDEYAYGSASGTLSSSEAEKLREQISQLKTDLNELEDSRNSHLNRAHTHPALIEKYQNFLRDLRAYGSQKPILKIDSIGKQDDPEKVDIDSININQAPGMAMSLDVVNAVSQYLEATVQSLIAGGAANVMNNIGINQENLLLAQQILNLMDSSIFKILSILKFVPSNIHMVPSAKVAMSNICTSLKDMFDAMYTAVEQKYYETINDAITNLPSAQEALKDAQEVLLTLATNMINELCVRYTGYQLVELYYMCHDLIAKYKYWLQKRKEMKQLREQGYIDAGINNEIDDKAVKALLMEELAHASDLMYNAFIIIQIKDAIEQLRDLIRQFNNIDLTVLADGIDSLDDLINLLDEIGLNDDSAVLSLKDAIEKGINGFQNLFNGLTNQLIIQGIASGANIASTTINNAHLQTNIGTEQAFQFSNNLDNFEITLTINLDPTLNKIRKNIMSALSKAEDNQGKRIFEANDVLAIIAALDKGYTEKKDLRIEIANMNFIIHFTIDGFNLPAAVPYDVYKYVEQALQLAEEKRRQDIEDSISTFELGVVTEEYTENPTEAAKRPTILLVHELYAILTEVFPLMKIFAELVSNYKINKAKVENHALGNLYGMIKVLAKLNNLLKKCNTNNKNFYTIRSLQTYHYVTEQIKLPEGDSSELNLSLKETRTLLLYLKARSLNYSMIDSKKETVVYIDHESLNEQKNKMQDALDKAQGYFGEDASLFVEYPEPIYEDGTTLGLDKVEVAGDDIYYSDSSLPVFGSQIMWCYARDYDVSI